MITTKLHEAIQHSANDRSRQFFDAWVKLPHYLIDQSVLALMAEVPPATQKGMVSQALANDEFHLPFGEVLVEYETSIYQDEALGHSEHGAVVNARVFLWMREVMIDEGVCFCISQGQLRYADLRAFADDVTFGFSPVPDGGFRFYGDTRIELGGDSLRLIRESYAQLLFSLVFARRVKGVDQAFSPAPAKLNKARAAKGKPPVTEFTVMRVGHYYDRAGNKHSMPTGRTVRVHMRAGHTRGQHYGPKNSLLKTIYVPPTIVNFDPNVEVPMPKRIVTA